MAFTPNPLQENLAVCPNNLCNFLEIVVKGDGDYCARANNIYHASSSVI